jgi:hypothetical protein
MVNGQLLRESPASAISRGAPNPEIRFWRGKTTKPPSGEGKAVEECAEKVYREALLSVKQYLEESVMEDLMQDQRRDQRKGKGSGAVTSLDTNGRHERDLQDMRD